MTERRPSAGTSQAEKSDTATFPTASTMIPSANTSEKNASLLTKASGVLLLCYIVFCFSRDLPAAVTSIYNAHPIFSDKSVVDGPAVGDSGGKVDVVWAPETLNGIPNDVREYWMGRKSSALIFPCSFFQGFRSSLIWKLVVSDCLCGLYTGC